MKHVDFSWQCPQGWAAAFANPVGGWDCYETWEQVPPELKAAAGVDGAE